MHPTQSFPKSRTFFAATLALCPLSQAQTTHTWTNTTGGAQNWNTGTNWSGTTAPNPVAGDTVDFSTINIAANTVLTLDADRTAGIWKFGDTTSTQTWAVNSGFTMTLAGPTNSSIHVPFILQIPPGSQSHPGDHAHDRLA